MAWARLLAPHLPATMGKYERKSVKQESSKSISARLHHRNCRSCHRNVARAILRLEECCRAAASTSLHHRNCRSCLRNAANASSRVIECRRNDASASLRLKMRCSCRRNSTAAHKVCLRHPAPQNVLQLPQELCSRACHSALRVCQRELATHK